MTRQPKNPSEDFNVGYEAGWAGHARQRDAEHAIEVAKLEAELTLLRARLKQETARAEAAEKRAEVTERKVSRAAK